MRTSTLATSVACSIWTPSISSRRSPAWTPALRPGLAGFTYKRFDAALAVDPDHAVFGQAESVLLLKVDKRRTHRQLASGW